MAGEQTQTRAVFLKPPSFKEELASVFVEEVSDKDGKKSIKLTQDYGDDLKPEEGWVVEIRGELYEIESIKDGVYTCKETKSHPAHPAHSARATHGHKKPHSAAEKTEE